MLVKLTEGVGAVCLLRGENKPKPKWINFEKDEAGERP